MTSQRSGATAPHTTGRTSATGCARRWSAAAAGLLLIAIAGCAAADDPKQSTSPASCEKDSLELIADGKLTIATDNPAYSPWFVDNEPSNGEGYESAVGYAIADQLGFQRSEVSWTVASFNSVIAPGAKKFDFDLNQVSISDERRNAVDFSSSYYDVRQAVVTYSGSEIEEAESLADLKSAKLGAQVGTTSFVQASQQIEPTTPIAPYDTNDLAVQALKNKQIAGIVVDLPTAFYMTSAQLDDGVVVGQLPASKSEAEQFGAVLARGSALTPCITKAVDALRSDGTLEKLEKKWLSTQSAPELS